LGFWKLGFLGEKGNFKGAELHGKTENSENGEKKTTGFWDFGFFGSSGIKQQHWEYLLGLRYCY
jgi:hypothetical protein